MSEDTRSLFDAWMKAMMAAKGKQTPEVVAAKEKWRAAVRAKRERTETTRS